MGLLDFLFEIGGSMLESAKKQQADIYKQASTKMQEYEKTVQKAEQNSSKMSNEQQKKVKAAREKLEKAKTNFSETTLTNSKGVCSVTQSGEILFGGKTISQWDREWVSIGSLQTANLTPYNHCVGLYRHIIAGKTKYVGRAIELNNGGFRKRLSDYRRESNSARKHTSGKIIHEHLNEITTYILVVGNTQDAVEITKKLEGQFISKYNPEWNKMINV